MNEVAEKELAGEIYLAVTRLNELIITAARDHAMRTDVTKESVNKIGFAPYDRVRVEVYKQIHHQTRENHDNTSKRASTSSR